MKYLFKGVKRQVTNWKKIFANYIFDKELVSGIYKDISKLKSKKTKQSTWKIVKRHKQVLHHKGDTDHKDTYGKMFYIISY